MLMLAGACMNNAGNCHRFVLHGGTAAIQYILHNCCHYNTSFSFVLGPRVPRHPEARVLHTCLLLGRHSGSPHEAAS